MAERGIIMISQRELRRLSIIHKVIDKRLKQVDAANILCLSERQITVQEHINGNISLRYKNRALHSKEITNRPKRKITTTNIIRTGHFYLGKKRTFLNWFDKNCF